MPVKVSVICPSWNRAVGRSIRSVARQTFRDIELIVVDDGSVPPLDLDNAAGDGTFVRVISHATNRGPAAARNTGAAAAQGEWLAFIDSDDEWTPLKLERQLAFAELQPHAAEPAAYVTGFSSRDKMRGQTVECIPRPAGSVEEFASGCWCCPGSTLLIRRDTFLGLGGYDDKLFRLEDYEFFLRFGLAGGTMHVLPEYLSHIHIQNVPRIDRVDHATTHVLEKYKQSKEITGPVLRSIAAFCRLARASTYFRHRKFFRTLWNLALSWTLVPRRTVHLIDRFPDRPPTPASTRADLHQQSLIKPVLGP